MVSTGRSPVCVFKRHVSRGEQNGLQFLPELPHAKDALEPFLSAETLEYHHGKHHNTYVTTLTGLSHSAAPENGTQEDLESGSFCLRRALSSTTRPRSGTTAYWKCMKPAWACLPVIYKAIDASFGSYEGFVKEFTARQSDSSAPGWAWLVKEGSELKITKTGNADLPKHSQTALHRRCVEHAYYIDYATSARSGDLPRQPGQLGLRGSELLPLCSRSRQWNTRPVMTSGWSRR